MLASGRSKLKFPYEQTTKFVPVTEAAGLMGHTKLEALSNITWSRSHRKILNVR